MKKILAILLVIAMLAAFPAPALAVPSPLVAADVRAAAVDMGFRSLASTPLPPVDLTPYIKPGTEELLKVMGKALFWDMQVGSDGQACASCHFTAGIDSRSKNQLNPNTKGGDSVFGNSAVAGAAGFPQFGVDYAFTAADFPTHKLENPAVESYTNRVVTQDTNDSISSQGVVNQTFVSATPGVLLDTGTPVADPIFNVNNTNVRRVEPRNTPTMINALYNFANFWDGRAHNNFNGSSPFGPLDTDAGIWMEAAGALAKTPVAIANSSLASQAVGPPLSVDEMSFAGRTWPDVGHKLLTAQPLKYQEVSATDSVLGPYVTTGGKGLTIVNYAALVGAIFQNQYWNSSLTVGGYSQMELNFSLFFGLAVQAYEFTLISGQTAFDAFMGVVDAAGAVVVAGDDNALTQEQMMGFLIFMNIAAPTQQQIADDPATVRIEGQFGDLFAGVGKGACVPCHFAAEFTSQTFTVIQPDPLVAPVTIEQEFMAHLDANGVLVPPLTINDPNVLFFQDEGFYNIGVRPTAEDLGRGDTFNGKPLSYVGQSVAHLGLPFATDPLPSDPEFPVRPVDDRISTAGKFKVPGLRNVALTAPYFHNGGQATLAEVIEFYDRKGDFADINIADVDGPLADIEMLPTDEAFLIAFLNALTDPRVVDDAAPFDHPQLFVANDGLTTFSTQNNTIVATGSVLAIPAVGAVGRQAAGLAPIINFLAAPVAANETYVATGTQPLVVSAPGVLANDSDADGAPSALTAQLVAGPVDAVFTLNPDGSFTFTNNVNPANTTTATFTYQAFDGNGVSNTATVTVTVNRENFAPVAVNEAYTATGTQPLVVAAPGVLGNDTDDDYPNPLTAQLVAAPKGAALTLNADGSFTFTGVNLPYTHDVTFTYKAFDGDMVSNIVTVTVTVNPDLAAPFSIAKAEGWSILSSPVKLGAGYNTLAQVFGNTLTNVETAYAWNGTQWAPADGNYVLLRLDAIFIKVKPGTTAIATFVAAANQPTEPPTKALVSGINLIGIAPQSVDGMYGPMLLSDVLTSVAASGYQRGYLAVISPGSQQDAWVYFTGAANVPYLQPFVGYWVIMDNADTLYGYSTGT